MKWGNDFLSIFILFSREKNTIRFFNLSHITQVAFEALIFKLQDFQVWQLCAIFQKKKPGPWKKTVIQMNWYCFFFPKDSKINIWVQDSIVIIWFKKGTFLDEEVHVTIYVVLLSMCILYSWQILILSGNHKTKRKLQF